MTLTPQQEAEQVTAVFEHTLLEGSVWHVLSSKFWNGWCEYTGFVPDLGRVGAEGAPRGAPRPDPIDNASLLDAAYPASEGVIRKDAMENEQYALVEERVAALLYEWYGGAGPQLAREVVTIGVRKRCKVDVHPLRFRLLACDPNTGAAPAVPSSSSSSSSASAAATSLRSQSMTSKATFSDLQEKLHNEATKAREQAAAPSDGSAMEEVKSESLEPIVRLWVRKPPSTALVVSGAAAASSSSSASSSSAAAAPASSSSSSSSSAGPAAMDLSMDDDHFAAPPKVTEPADDTAETKENEAAAAGAATSTALVVVSAVSDVALDSTTATASSSSSSTAAATSAAMVADEGVTIPNYKRPYFEAEWKDNYRKGCPGESLDEADNARRKLDPNEPGVRVRAGPPVVPLDDGWRLLGEEDLIVALDAQDLPPVSDVLVETQVTRIVLDAEGVGTITTVWPRAAYSPTKSWNDFEIEDIIDVKDTEGAWIEAQVRGIKPGHIFVHYQGWKDGWDEWIPTTETSRLAARNTHTTPDRSSSSYSSSSSRSYSSYSYSGNDDGKPEVSGGVGLRNLGNTCFMNSTLQCLSHCVPLTDYFLDELYLSDLNRTNPLGWSGRVAEEYAKLIKDIWSDKFRVVAPRDLKTVIGEFQPRFEGYAQHDSSELLAFVLDGLHEDLNRVKVKPPTPSVDSNGREDAVVAAEAWATYQKRNRSIIVDTLQGQLKSKVTCPIASCGKVSITFDPVQMLSVPLPVAQDTVVTIHLVLADASKPVMQVAAVVSKVARMSELKEAICTAVNGAAPAAAPAADGSASSAAAAAAAPASPSPLSTPLLSRRLVLADIFSGKVYKFFEEDGLVSDIKSNDVVYAYECPEIDAYVAKDSPAGGFFPVSLMLQRKELNPYYSARYSSNAADEFRFSNYALPRVLCFPKKTQLTVRTILERIHAKVAPHLRGGGAPSGQAPQLTIDECPAQAYSVIVTDDRGDNCGVHENTGWSASKCNGCVLREYSALPQRDSASAASDKAATEKTTAAYRASQTGRAIPTGNTAFDVLSGTMTMCDTSDDEEEGGDASDSEPVTIKIEADVSDDEAAGGSGATTDGSGAESNGSAVLVNASPSPQASPDATAEGFVNVATDGKMTDAATPAAAAAATDAAPAAAAAATDLPLIVYDLDVPFNLRTGQSYMSYVSDIVVRAAFVVRLHNVEAPLVPLVPLPLVEAAADMQVDADGNSIKSVIEPAEPAAAAAAAPAVVAAPYIWFDKDSSDREIKHASSGSDAVESFEGVSIQDCVKAFVKEETLSEEDPWYCSNCKEHRQATKKFDLWKLPEVLIIHLKRFSYSKYSRDKITTFVNFPIVGLDLSEHTVNPAHNGDLYDLFAVSNHMGGLGGGHYNAYCKNHTDGHWYLHDDSSVSRVRSAGEIRTSSAYVLFYRRRAKGAEAPAEEKAELSNAAKPVAAAAASSSSMPPPAWGGPAAADLD